MREKYTKIASCWLVLIFMYSMYVVASNTEPETEEVERPIYYDEPQTMFELQVERQAEKLANSKVEMPTYYCAWLCEPISEDDFKLLCRTTWCESGNQDLQTQVMVCLTILNRYASGDYESIRHVIYSKNAYEVTTWSNFEEYYWTEQVEQAVTIALQENNHPRNMLYFRTEHYHTFGTPYMVSDDLWFSTN